MVIRIMCFLLLLGPCGSALAQNYSGDARRIAMGGVGYSDNLASRFIEEERQYRSIVIPLGIIQLIRDLDKFDLDNKNIFDPILAMEYAANPIHYQFDRIEGGMRGQFVSDLINGEISRDLNDYRGFNLTNDLSAEGLLSPGWGYTFKLFKTDAGSFQGFYVGAGPYISIKTDLHIDEALTDVLKSPTYVSIPNRNYEIDNQSAGQLALSLTGGYRARFALPGSGDSNGKNRNGVYVAMDYHYLYGFRYEDMDLAVQLDTDSEGLLTVMPESSPIDLYYLNSRSGRGFALDFGLGVVLNGWEFGFGANGVANRIDWQNLTMKRFSLESVLEGGDFTEERIPLADTDLRVELPVQYSGNIGYNGKAFSAVAEVTRGYQGTAFHGGMEYRLRVIEFRGGDALRSGSLASDDRYRIESGQRVLNRCRCIMEHNEHCARASTGTGRFSPV
ncbi:MAG: hypothetical protein JXR49_13620 [Acidobacteria bacterium]|nr:hypothetical protein [Acidobacteriota bacterium]